MVNGVTIKTISCGENLIRYLLADAVTAELEQEIERRRSFTDDADCWL